VYIDSHKMNSNNTNNIINNITHNLSSLPKYGILKLWVNPVNTDLVDLYRQHIDQHNQAISESAFPNSGFDIFVPNTMVFSTPGMSQMINHEIKGEMIFCDRTTQTNESCAYMMYPRSSLSKTPLMLANHVGIIDSGYRGFLMGAFRLIGLGQNNEYIVDKHTRLLQICLPTLHPIYVVMVNESELSDSNRGTGGFGSTGLNGLLG